MFRQADEVRDTPLQMLLGWLAARLTPAAAQTKPTEPQPPVAGRALVEPYGVPYDELSRADVEYWLCMYMYLTSLASVPNGRLCSVTRNARVLNRLRSQASLKGGTLRRLDLSSARLLTLLSPSRYVTSETVWLVRPSGEEW